MIHVAILCYSVSVFGPRNPPIVGWQTRKLSATNQQWSLWLYTQYLTDMFPHFWIRRPSTFGKYSIFHSLQGFTSNNFTSRNAILFIFSGLKGHRFLDVLPNFLFSDFYLIVLLNFKIGSLLDLSCLMSSMFIIILTIRIIKTTCFDNTKIVKLP